MPPSPAAFISIVVPVYDEEDAIAAFLARLATVTAKLPVGHEIIFVDDGSTDRTLARLRAQQAVNLEIGIVELSRNFGKEAAVVAGLEAARGAAVIVMDVDLQDPPELVSDMVARWRKGADVVIAIRDDRSSDSIGKRTGARFFYSLFAMLSDTRLPEGSGDFRLMDRPVVDAFLQLGERSRFNKGLFAWLGFRQEFVHHVRPPASRQSSRWRPLRLVRFALDGFFSFSTIPIRIWSLVGGLIAGISFLYGVFLVIRTLLWGIDVPGYASTMVAVLLLGGINLFTLGLLGEYIGRVLTETKRRPLYIVRDRVEAVPAPVRQHPGKPATLPERRFAP